MKRKYFFDQNTLTVTCEIC